MGVRLLQEQATRPQTIGYSLVDSPVGLCARIVEKFRAWTDCDGHPENALTRDELLDNLMLYWLPEPRLPARLYWESSKQVNGWIVTTDDTVAVPTGCSIFSKELQRPFWRWATKRFLDIRYRNEIDRGGHLPPSSSRSCSSTRSARSSGWSDDPRRSATLGRCNDLEAQAGRTSMTRWS